jgi:Holliday junction resolvase RusA-like endonuclease
MSDLVQRLRESIKACRALDRSALLAEAADELERISPMNAITFSVPGDPVPQPRARVSTAGGFARAYVPKTHPVHAYRHAIQLAAIDAGLRNDTATVQVVIDAVFARPKSHMNKKGVKADAPQLPRPDVDNLAKAVLDAIGPILGDDTQVSRLVVEKSYGTEARTTVRIT